MESSTELEKGDVEANLGGILDMLIWEAWELSGQDAHESFKYWFEA